MRLCEVWRHLVCEGGDVTAVCVTCGSHVPGLLEVAFYAEHSLSVPPPPFPPAVARLRVGLCLAETTLIYTCGPGVIVGSISAYSQKSYLDDKLCASPQ